MEPTLNTLQDAIVYFSDSVNCREYVVARRWPNGVECPRCGSKNVTFLLAWHFPNKYTIFDGLTLPKPGDILARWSTSGYEGKGAR